MSAVHRAILKELKDIACETANLAEEMYEDKDVRGYLTNKLDEITERIESLIEDTTIPTIN